MLTKILLAFALVSLLPACAHWDHRSHCRQAEYKDTRTNQVEPDMDDQWECKFSWSDVKFWR